ncbi:metallophosphoesterase [Vibrio sp. H11]|uniref:metallophosphoesterase n=1 Tax=Vibrio sp. H11 TaxID=2565928 RepID=UPI0010A66F4B|nr:metallophosphoesterase [Vibrio sp. H11]
MNALEKLPLHRSISANTSGRDLFIGDVHGDFTLLIHALKMVHFDKYRDRVFAVGDLTDRGNDSWQCLTLAREKWFYPVLGNHESFILQRYDESPDRQSNWLLNGGGWWLQLSPAQQALAREIVVSQYSLTLSVAVGNKTIGVLHAEYPYFNWPPQAEFIDEELRHRMLWGRDDILRSSAQLIDNVDFVVCGHTPLDCPKIRKNKLFIDTGSGYEPNNFIPDPRLSVCEFHPNAIEIRSFNLHDEKRTEIELV